MFVVRVLAGVEAEDNAGRELVEIVQGNHAKMLEL